MAGIRHHIVPQFLLRGFASRRKGKKVFTWIYRRNSKPFESSIRNIAVSKHFYGKDGETADDTITEQENDLAVLVNHLRDSSGPVNTDGLPALIIHLITRTKVLRDNFESASDAMIAELQHYMEQPENMKGLLLRRVKGEVDKILKENRVLNVLPPSVQARMEHDVRGSIEKDKSRIAASVGELLNCLRESFPKIVKDGHNKALLRLHQPQDDSVRKEWYEQFRWRVDVTNIPLILSDAMCLFRCGHDRFRILDDAEHMATGVFCQSLRTAC